MAGMLPGVECARRRRLHQTASADSAGGTRRLSLALYSTNYEATNSSAASPRSVEREDCEGEKLGGAAGEAKERLDERLRVQRKSSRSQKISRNEDLGSRSSRLGKLRMIVASWRPTDV